MRAIHFVLCGIAVSASAYAQSQQFYAGSNATGQLALTGSVNVLAVAQANLGLQTSQSAPGMKASALAGRPESAGAELPRSVPASEFRYSAGGIGSRSMLGSKLKRVPLASQQPALSPRGQGLQVSQTNNSFGFLGMTHYDMRNANQGNQFSVEPPSQGLAVGNGYVVEGVNNAFQVYDTSGRPQLPAVLTTNQVFGVSAAIDRTTGINGVYPTDIRIFYDQTLNKFFVLQRAQDNDIFGDPLSTSHIYLAVSQTGDPTGTYNDYVLDTSDSQSLGCPCLSDYPEIGADQYGIYITWNEYDALFDFRQAEILAVSKASLASSAITPTAYKLAIPFNTGYEFAIYPATTPPGGSYFLGSGGLEYFLSSKRSLPDTNVALWALTNTGSLQTAKPVMLMVQISVSTLYYQSPYVGIQPPGPVGSRPLGESLGAGLEVLDGADARILGLEYVGGRLYTTLGTQVTDDNGTLVSAGAYMVITPTYRGGILSGSALREGYLIVNNNHVLRPSIAVNAQGNGAIAFTLVGPDYFPSAAFVPFSSFTPGYVQIAASGTGPEDGFSGYPYYGGDGSARWGDYSAAVCSSDGSIWMGTEYIPGTQRTQLANWGTYLFNYRP